MSHIHHALLPLVTRRKINKLRNIGLVKKLASYIRNNIFCWDQHILIYLQV